MKFPTEETPRRRRCRRPDTYAIKDTSLCSSRLRMLMNFWDKQQAALMKMPGKLGIKQTRLNRPDGRTPANTRVPRAKGNLRVHIREFQ